MTSSETEKREERIEVTLGDFPRLTRFFGIPPSELQDMPRALLEVYAKELPKLQAEELLNLILAADMPYAEANDRKRVIGLFERIAAGHRPAPEEPTKVEIQTEEGQAMAASLGIGFRKGTK